MGISFILEKTGRNSQITIETKIKMASTDVNSMEYPNTDSIIEDVYELKLASPAQPVNTTTIQETIEIKYEEIPPQVTNVSSHELYNSYLSYLNGFVV